MKYKWFMRFVVVEGVDTNKHPEGFIGTNMTFETDHDHMPSAVIAGLTEFTQTKTYELYTRDSRGLNRFVEAYSDLFHERWRKAPMYLGSEPGDMVVFGNFKLQCLIFQVQEVTE